MHGSVHLFERLPLVAPPVEADSRAGAPPPVRAVPLVGVIRNGKSHQNGVDMPEWNGRAQLIVERPRRRRELQDILTRFARQRIDYLVIDGGDGTVRDVLTCGASVFGKSWPELILIPNGKTNALASDLALPADWNLETALAAAGEGKFVHRNPLVVSQSDMPDAQVHGFIFGAGAYTHAVGLGQEAHRHGAFNAMAVAMTTGWTLLQAIFGRKGNIWRRGTAMQLRGGDGVPLPHSGVGPVQERYFVIATSLDSFPAGLTPFRGVAGPLRLAALDRAYASILLRLPLVFAGRVTRGMERGGVHRFGGDSFEIDLKGSFILDGEAFPPGQYRISLGPKLRFIVP